MKSIILTITCILSLSLLTAQPNAKLLVDRLTPIAVDTAYIVDVNSLGYQKTPELPYSDEKRITLKCFKSSITFDRVFYTDSGVPIKGILYFFCLHDGVNKYELKEVIYEFK